MSKTGIAWPGRADMGHAMVAHKEADPLMVVIGQRIYKVSVLGIGRLLPSRTMVTARGASTTTAASAWA